MRITNKRFWAFGLTVAAALVAIVMGAVSTTAAAPGHSDQEHIGQYNFMVEIEGEIIGQFQSIEGLDCETEVIEYMDGADPILKKRPGRTRYSNLVLIGDPASQGMIFMLGWYEQIVNGSQDKHSGSIVIEDKRGNEVGRYDFTNAFPCKWEGPSFDSSGGEVNLQEKVELAIEKVDFS